MTHSLHLLILFLECREIVTCMSRIYEFLTETGEVLFATGL